MSERLFSLPLATALVGAAALRGASVPALLDPRPLLARTLDHAASLPARFRRRPSGLFVPASPALIGRASDTPSGGSGPIAGVVGASLDRAVSANGAGLPRGEWSDAIDADGLVRFLRARHPQKPAWHVAALTGESPETVRKWLKRETRPGFRATLSLVCAYGPDLLDASLTRTPGWMDDVRTGLDRARLIAELRALAGRIDAALVEPEAA